MLKKLDVPLRDGGYRNPFSFSIDYIIEHIKNLTAAQIEYIEIGDPKGYPIDNVGQTALCSNEIHLFHNAFPGAKSVMLAPPSHIPQWDIGKLKNKGPLLVLLNLRK
ncbi:hypothetical protein MNL06_06180 [Bartonella krasnovii]|uniref:hypothetical protein n=1 Tax=Bartonella krasnovii TaxID=2267275 RepID=UPI001F4D098B|nr:hypothetical protein [Bartonella krasnovii]UNF45137.1 hypothetical protein MNL06_06180 [Bartonella krasnovii]